MRGDDEAANDIRETVGLVLNIAAVIAFVLSLNSFGTGHPGAAALVGTAAAVAFLASLLCFAGDEPVEDAEPGSLSAAFNPMATGDGFDAKARAA